MIYMSVSQCCNTHFIFNKISCDSLSDLSQSAPLNPNPRSKPASRFCCPVPVQISSSMHIQLKGLLSEQVTKRTLENILWEAVMIQEDTAKKLSMLSQPHARSSRCVQRPNPRDPSKCCHLRWPGVFWCQLSICSQDANQELEKQQRKGELVALKSGQLMQKISVNQLRGDLCDRWISMVSARAWMLKLKNESLAYGSLPGFAVNNSEQKQTLRHCTSVSQENPAATLEAPATPVVEDGKHQGWAQEWKSTGPS